MAKLTYLEIAADWELWQKFAASECTMSRREWDALEPYDRARMWAFEMSEEMMAPRLAAALDEERASLAVYFGEMTDAQLAEELKPWSSAPAPVVNAETRPAQIASLIDGAIFYYRGNPEDLLPSSTSLFDA